VPFARKGLVTVGFKLISPVPQNIRVNIKIPGGAKATETFCPLAALSNLGWTIGTG